MKTIIGLLALVAIVSSCSSTRDFTRVFEDDIYYVPGKQSLLVQQIEKKTGETISLPSTNSRYNNNPIDPNVLAKERAEANSEQVNPNAKTTGMARYAAQYATQNQVEKAQARSNAPILINEDAEGYWIGGFKGNEADLEECVRIMNRYPQGFANFGNAHQIAMRLSFDPDWNVYTVNNRYWWFPSNSNIELYSKLIFGTYPQYIWTVVWNDPRFDSYALDRMNFRFGFNYSWGGGNWAWNNWYNPWGWNQYPYWGSGFYPGWRYDSWYWHNRYWNHGHWYPHYDRPNWGHINKPSYKPHYATRTHYTNNRNARSYSTYSRPYRSSSSYGKNNKSWESSRNQNSSSNPGYSSGSYSRSSSSSYGRSSTTRSGGHSGSREHKETGRRK